MRHTPLKRVGRIGRANMEANSRLRAVLGTTGHCEMKLKGCLGTWPLQFAHRHKRSWYKGDVEKLSDIKQVVVACQNCHEKQENDEQLTEAIFFNLRGHE